MIAEFTCGRCGRTVMLPKCHGRRKYCLDCSSELTIERNREYRKRKSAPATAGTAARALENQPSLFYNNEKGKSTMRRIEKLKLLQKVVLRSSILEGFVGIEGIHDANDAENAKIEVLGFLHDEVRYEESIAANANAAMSEVTSV